ncbi:ABC transporter substrate-binding protein [Dethiosulfovibrio sp. F2B]|uniref:ABC transporter substrate-binding protein n=1 Tax=Dethiosulfovibrio faecalis TaxID=2720018 RepID=UPI001F3EDCD2|nr:ABC transporter substrate-binding protein [Dethiosulfovibrio faecalis]MCF4151288.1 ABC transporter substrate-binding protein [Dethiosulfovibrio faecalis]
MKKTLALTIGFIALALSVSSATASQKTLRAYTIWSERYAKAIFDAFTSDTGIKVEWMRFSSGELQARLEAEKANPQVDVVFGNMAEAFVDGMAKGLFDPYLPEKAEKIPPEFRDEEGYWTGVALDPICFMTNQKFLQDKGMAPPKSWDDLLDDRYGKRLQMADARTSGTAMYRVLSLVQAMGEDEAYAYQMKLNDNVQVYTKSGSGGALPIARGQAAGGIFFLVDALEMKQKGYPVVVSYPEEGVVAGIEAMALVKEASRPDLAKLFLDWASGERMQRLYGENGINLVPTNPDVPPATPELDIKSIKILPLDVEWAGANRDRLVERWVEEVLR